MIAIEKLAGLKGYEASPVFECTEELGTLSLGEPGVSIVENKNGKSVSFHYNGATYYFPIKDAPLANRFHIRKMAAVRDWPERNITTGDTYAWAYGFDFEPLVDEGSDMPF